MGGSLNYITGHSLGGSAATLYTALGAPGKLVTFGSAPTALLEYSKAENTYVKGKFNIEKGVWEERDAEYIWVLEKNKYMGRREQAVAGEAPAWKPDSVVGEVGGIRFFHKFDPVPGFYYNGGGYGHQVSTGVILYDTSGECMGRTPIAAFLCTDFKVQLGMEFAPVVNYYSYTNAFNPVPCAEVALGHYAKYVEDTVANIDTRDWKEKWVPHETLEKCAYSYLASVEAYAELWFYSQLIGQAYNRDHLFWLSFYGMWGLWWIHSSYPGYMDIGFSAPTLSADPPVFDGASALDIGLEKTYGN